MNNSRDRLRGPIFIWFSILAALIAVSIFIAIFFFTQNKNTPIRNRNLKIPIPSIPTRPLLTPEPLPQLIENQASDSADSDEDDIDATEEAGPSAEITQ